MAAVAQQLGVGGVRARMMRDSQETKTRDAVSKAQQRIAKHEKTWWFFAIGVAAAIDFLDIIPFMWLLKFPLIVYIVVFNFRHGKIRARILRFLVILIDIVPIISLMPANIVIILLMWNRSRRKSNEAKRFLAQSIKTQQMTAAYLEA